MTPELTIVSSQATASSEMRAPQRAMPDGGSRLQPRLHVTLARTKHEVQAAGRLLESLYASRGYLVSQLDADPGSDLILLAAEGSDAIGTLTLRLDGPLGLRADETYADELDLVRAQGRRACEFGRFAVARHAHSKAVIGSLFGHAYEIVRERRELTDVFIEVNPRHAPFYRRAFGFRVAADERTCPRVRAPSVLLRLEVAAFEALREPLASERCSRAFPRGLPLN